jgi:hypothetical protein
LAGALIKLIRDPERSHQFGEAGRRLVEQQFDLRWVVSQYEELYLTCLASSRSGLLGEGGSLLGCHGLATVPSA